MSVEEIIDPAYTIFPDDVIDESTYGVAYNEYRPEETILNSAQDDNVSNNFTIIMDNHSALVKPSDAILDVKFKIIKNDGTNYASTDVITLGANAQLLFQNAKLEIGGMTVEDIPYPGYCNTIRSLMELDGDYISKNGAVEGLWLEKARYRTGDEDDSGTNSTVFAWSAGAAYHKKYEIDATTKAIESISHIFNDSYRKRFFRTQGSAEAEISIPLRRVFKLVDEYQGVLRGVDVRVALTKQSDYNLVVHGGGAIADAPRVVITDLRIRYPHLTPSPAALLKIQEELNSDVVKKLIYPNWQTRFSQSYDFNTTYQRWKANTLTRPPLYAFVMFQNGRCFSQVNDQTLPDVKTSTDNISNPLKFKSAANDGGQEGFTDISRVTLYVGGDRHPSQDWRMDFTADDYSQVYSEFLRVTGKAPYGDPNECSFVDSETFKLQYPIFAFDLRPMASKMFSETTNSIDLEVEWQVEAGTAFTYRAVVVYCDERCLNFGTSGGQMMIEQC
jgi:hypothetical protein